MIRLLNHFWQGFQNIQKNLDWQQILFSNKYFLSKSLIMADATILISFPLTKFNNRVMNRIAIEFKIHSDEEKIKRDRKKQLFSYCIDFTPQRPTSKKQRLHKSWHHYDRYRVHGNKTKKHCLTR